MAPASPSVVAAPRRAAAPESRGETSSASPSTAEPPLRAAEPEPPVAEPEAEARVSDPAQRDRAAKARSSALREEAKTWTAATKLEFLRRRNVGDCQRCPLARTRNHIVFGVGNAEADLMFIGEAPGADEDRQGEPFVGRAGQLLNRWLEQLQLRREDVYIANVLKCRPPGNRDPRPEEVDKCSPFLQAQIRAIEPKVIVALGRHAGMLLSRREDMTLRAMRSTSRLSYDAGAPKDDPSARIKIPLVVTYHPAYVLRQEGDGRRVPDGRASPTELVMKDLERALAIVRGTGG
ncbi:MAG: uracil-DNA glycosylase [Myxococcales bacterium]|nr:uracil-DNA glycosylase [Myxococcales bacterium]MCB9712639.1 uracil-DNA glycosylase [Myxococcales bacterium]